jgi:hypothetical protein
MLMSAGKGALRANLFFGGWETIEVRMDWIANRFGTTGMRV